MAQVIVEGSSATERAGKMQRALEQGHNRPLNVTGTWVPRPTEFTVFLFTISKRSFVVSHALLPHIDIPACESGERYKKFRFIPHPFPQKVEDVFGTDREPYDYHSAERIAQDICNPANPTLNQGIEDYGKLDPFFAVQDGTNLARHGVFWSRNETPTETELVNVEKKRDNFYRFLIGEADTFYAADPRTAITKITTDHRMALDYFGEERPWHKKFIAQYACPNCAMMIPQTAAYHRDLDGDLCIVDWRQTVASGKRKKEDVPEELRWWTEEKRGPGRPRREDSPEAGV